MFMRELAAAVALVALCGAAAAQQSPNLGKAISPEDLATWDISIGPDGVGLPPGSGTPTAGRGRLHDEVPGLSQRQGRRPAQ